MTPLELLVTLRDRGVRLTPNVTTVWVEAPQGALTPALRAALREHTVALLDLLEVFEERAALIEYDGGIPRGEAERLAWACLRGATRTLRTAVVT
jgi:hypothetical protein